MHGKTIRQWGGSDKSHVDILSMRLADFCTGRGFRFTTPVEFHYNGSEPAVLSAQGKGMSLRIIKLVAALLMLPLLLGGTECTIVGRSGSGNSGDDDKSLSGLIVVIRDGVLVDGPVEGVYFESGSVSGFTGPNGEFQFEEGGQVRFSIGDIVLGQAVPARAFMTPLDLVSGGDLDTPAVINIARLLQSLDSVSGDDRITIASRVRNQARRSSDEVGAAVTDIDFSDEARFVNSATQLVISLGGNSRKTGVLVDAETARRHLRANLQAVSPSVQD